MANIGKVLAEDSVKKQGEDFTQKAKKLSTEKDAFGNRKSYDDVKSTQINRDDVQNVAANNITANQDLVNKQMELSNMLMQRARGEGPSVAQQQYKQNMDRNLASALAARAGVSGVNTALQNRSIARQQAENANRLAADTAMLRANEIAQAQSLAGQELSRIRTDDFNVDKANMEAQLQASLANQGIDLAVLKDNAARGDQASIANMEAALRQAGLNDAMIQSYMRQELGYDSLAAQQNQALMAQQQRRVELEQQLKEAQINRDFQKSIAIMNALAALGGAGIQAGLFSSTPKPKV